MYEKEQSKTLKSSTWIAIDVDWLSDEDLEKFISRHAIGDTHCEEDSGLRGRLDFIRHNLVLMIRNQKASISAKDRRAYHSNLEKRTEKLLQILDGIPEDIMYDLYLAGAIGKPVTSKYGIPGRMLDRNKLGEITRELEMIHKAAKEAGALLANKKDTNRADKWLLVEIGKMYEDFTG
ncbi:MAG: hypothetical protein OEZ38_14870, partial [Gammaproteobacteria bacterium]|nr:hypothetical protein [Gammaproteobacteria bacterium]